MGLFKRFLGPRGPKPPVGAEGRLSARIARRILAMQQSVASRLNVLAERMGTGRAAILLAVLLLGFAGYCGYLVLGALL